MRVYGEAFLLLNGWMNFLSLLLAARLAKARFAPGRAALAALLGALYAIFARMGESILQSIPFVLVTALGMALLTFGRRALRLFPMIVMAGLLLSGCADFLRGRGVGTGWIVALCGGATMGLCALLTRCGVGDAGQFTLIVGRKGRQVALPALRDSGNLLTDGVTGLPVIIAPEKVLRPLLPPAVRACDLSTLPAGFYLVGVRTAGGRRTLMCFHPEILTLEKKGKKWRLDAAVALSDFDETRALLPEMLFRQEEESHASL